MKTVLKTKDLYLSAFLFAKGLTLERLERENNICWFVFNQNPESQSLSDAYWSGKALCNARTYADSIRTLKDRIFNER